MVARAAERPNQLKVGGLIFPGFIDYSGDDSGIDILSGVISNTGTIQIGFDSDNPQNLDDRQNQTFWYFGQTVELLIQNSSGVFVLHPRGKLNLISSFWDAETEVLTLQVGCLISLLKNISAEDFDNRELIENPDLGLTEEEKKKLESQDWRNEFNKAKWHSTSKIVTTMLNKMGLGLSSGSVSGKTRGPYQISGSLLEAVGVLAAKTTNPQFLWCNNNNELILSPINKDLTVFSAFNIGGDEGDDVSYKPIDTGLSTIDKLIVTGQIPIPSKKKPDGEVTTDENGFQEKYSISYERGPEATVVPGGSTNEIVTAIVERWEKKEQGFKTIKTLRTERRGLVFPTITTGRSDFITASKQIQVQAFNGGGKLQYEEEISLQPFGKVFNAWLSKYPNYIVNVTQPSITPTVYINSSGGFSFYGFPAGAGYADELINNQSVIVGSYKKTDYQYNAREEISNKTTSTWVPVSSVTTTLPTPFITNYAISTQEVESWSSWGKDQNHTLVSRLSFEAKESDSVASLDTALWKAKADAGVTEKTSVPTFKRNGSTITPGTTDINTPQLSWETRMTLVFGQDENEASRGGNANTPATEYQPNYPGTEDPDNPENAEDWEEQTINAVRTWARSDSSPYRPPRERSNVGKVENAAVVRALADVIYLVRQGESKLHQLVLPLTDAWLSGSFKPVMRVDVVEPNGNAVSYLAHGFCWTMNATTNLVSFDCLWLGGCPSSFVYAESGGQWLEIDAA